MSGRYKKESLSEQMTIEKLRGYPSAVAAFYYDMRDRDKSYATASKYIDYVIHFVSFFADGAIKEDFYKETTSADIERYMDVLKTRTNVKGNSIDVGDGIRAVRWSAINSFFSFLVDRNYIAANPVAKTQRPSQRKAEQVVRLTKEEISEILQNVRRDAKPSFVNRDLAVLSLALTTGLRISEISNLDVSDIDFNQDTISIVVVRRNQEEQRRVVRFGDNLKKTLSAWLKERSLYYCEEDPDALFLSQMRERLSTDMINRMIKKYSEGVTDKKITSQGLRASYAVGVFEQTGNVQMLSEVMSTNVATAARYACASDAVSAINDHYHMDQILDTSEPDLSEDMSMPWEKRMEALKRLKLLKLREAASIFPRGNTVLVSENKANYPRKLNEKEVAAVKEFEQEHNCMVYHAVLCKSDFGQLLALLYVTQDKHMWDEERASLQNRKTLAYCVNLDKPSYSQFCTIGFLRRRDMLSRIG